LEAFPYDHPFFLPSISRVRKICPCSPFFLTQLDKKKKKKRKKEERKNEKLERKVVKSPQPRIKFGSHTHNLYEILIIFSKIINIVKIKNSM
jgi:hypothetical protein